MQAVTQSEATVQVEAYLEPARTPGPTAPLRELLIDAILIGAAVLAVVLTVVASGGY
jgi:hypothetical protein